MNEPLTSPDAIVLTVIKEGGPIFMLLLFALLGLGIRHLCLSFRCIVKRATSLPIALHAIYLIATPVSILLYLLWVLPTTIPGLFLFGFDADVPLTSGLRQASFLGGLGLASFTMNFALVIIAIHRSSANENARKA